MRTKVEDYAQLDEKQDLKNQIRPLKVRTLMVLNPNGLDPILKQPLVIKG